MENNIKIKEKSKIKENTFNRMKEQALKAKINYREKQKKNKSTSKKNRTKQKQKNLITTKELKVIKRNTTKNKESSKNKKIKPDF